MRGALGLWIDEGCGGVERRPGVRGLIWKDGSNERIEVKTIERLLDLYAEVLGLAMALDREL